MLMNQWCLMVCFLGICSASSVYADLKKVPKLATIDWPPFTSPDLPGQGESTKMLRQTFKDMGLDLQVDFYPWRRAVKLGLEDTNFVGYFPEYDTKLAQIQCRLSRAIGHSQVAIVSNKRQPVVWQSLNDLKAVRLGVVNGYFNSDELDERIQLKIQEVDLAPTDLVNLRKLVAGRIDAIVIDTQVMSYLLRTDRMLLNKEPSLHIASKLLATHTLHVCFAKQQEELARQFDDALKLYNPSLDF